ncbi:anti-sigma factor domain-containing protein [Halobacillus faecis]|uniref:Anti-sigma-I factor RsgI n=1 Tax=Halobacillus faecis TaxID=360184 RepID=A0A511WS43_9BACI|nr:anti-sigma factor domain-containing protein [Halobacillus faecis]GEN53063.1 anti-sigma-I factor RsgI [Halobacillus faecis]
MKKGIVMEQQNEYMIVMTSDGKFHRAEKINHADIGMEVQFRTVDERKVLHQWTQVLRNRYTRAAVVAIIFLLMVFPVFSWYGSNQAYAYMNIDINPSVELELNDQMQVIDIIPQNDEADEIVTTLKDWKKKDASEVTFELIELSQERGYSNDANQVLIGISYLKEEVNQDYTEEIETFLMEKSANISIATFLVPKDLRRKAIEQKASVNEMVADRIKKEVTDQKGESELPVHVEDDDREIIQSFYKEDSSEEEQGEVLDSDMKPVAPPVVKPEKQDAKKREPEQARSKGKDQAPGQQKTKADQGESHIEEKDSKNKHIEKKDNKNPHKDNENKNSKDKHSAKPSPKSTEKEKDIEKDKNSGSKQEDKQNDRNKGSSSNDKEKTPQGNGNSSNGKHS